MDTLVMPSVIVPVKRLVEGKSRLAGALTPSERERLCAWMFGRTLGVLAAMGDVTVISDDLAVAAQLHAGGSSARFIHASKPGDLNAAISEARDTVPTERSLLVVPIDLVQLDQQSMGRFLDAADTVTIAPDQARRGTNLLYLSPSAAREFVFSYGVDSLGRHIREARRLGFDPHIYHSPATSIDVDTIDDLRITRAYVPRSDLATSFHSYG